MSTVTAIASESENGVIVEASSGPRSSYFSFAASYVASAVSFDPGSPKTTVSAVPVYSGYTLISPLVSAVSMISVEPMSLFSVTS